MLLLFVMMYRKLLTNCLAWISLTFYLKYKFSLDWKLTRLQPSAIRIHTSPWYWTTLVKFIARQSKLWPGGGFRQCPVVLFSQLPPINGMGGGVIIGKYFYSLFTCFCAYRSFLSNKIFVQEKTGNILVGGYPPPYWQKTNIFPVFSYEAFPKQARLWLH